MLVELIFPLKARIFDEGMEMRLAAAHLPSRSEHAKRDPLLLSAR
jgi:hypothetical protein